MLILYIWLSWLACVSEVTSMSCGIDNFDPYNDHPNASYEGLTVMETYPWLGILYYTRYKKRFTTAVVLVTRQLILATAIEIDKLPKEDFRANARVIVGQSCSAEPGIGILDYTYHPDYSKSTYSSIALIQLNIDYETTELRPICPPPNAVHIMDLPFYAMVLSDDCKRAMVTVHRMLFVPLEQCMTYYRRSGLDIKSLWPSHIACAKGITGGRCVWRSGAILVVKVGDHWHLLGFGVHGPGCQAPARFLDYGMYKDWVKRSVEKIGRPAITRVAANHLVLRRSLNKLQRFGPCDKEEMQQEFYNEYDTIKHEVATGFTLNAKYEYNLTIIDKFEYSCITMKADYQTPRKLAKKTDLTPKLWLRRWCGADSGEIGLCTSSVKYTDLNFYIKVEFIGTFELNIRVWGKPVSPLNPSTAHKIANQYLKSPTILTYNQTFQVYNRYQNDSNYPMYRKKKMKFMNFTRVQPTVEPIKITTTKTFKVTPIIKVKSLVLKKI